MRDDTLTKKQKFLCFLLSLPFTIVPFGYFGSLFSIGNY